MSYRVRISLSGIEVEIEGDREFVDSKLSNLGWLEELVGKLQTRNLGKKIVEREEKPSFNEFASELEPQNHGQRILSVAYYLYKWENRDFGYDDVENFYKVASWPTPSNPRDVVGDLIREGFLEDAGRVEGKKRFRILRKGIKLVENKFRESE